MDSNNEQDKNIPENLQSSDLDKKYQSDDESLSNPDSIVKSNLPSFKKILVTYDGKDKSDKAINYSIYLSNLSGAEINIVQVIENIDKFENTTLDVSNEKLTDKSMTSPSSNATEIKSQDYSVNVEGQIIKSMEEKIKTIGNTGFKNKVSYKVRTGPAVEEIVNEVNESQYDLLILSSSHLDSWIKSLFSDTRKIISNINTPVLLLQ
jgi:nucleotide-binding universal stress UspA family protein